MSKLDTHKMRLSKIIEYKVESTCMNSLLEISTKLKPLLWALSNEPRRGPLVQIFAEFGLFAEASYSLADPH